MRLTIVLLAALAASGCATSSRTGPAGPSLVLSDHFLEAAFGREYGPGATVLHKWTGPVAITVDGPLPAPVLTGLDSDLAVLAKATGLPIRRVPAAASGMVIHPRPARELPDAIAARLEGRKVPGAFHGNGCSSVASASRGIIRRVDIFVRAEQSDDDLAACLVEEVAQGLGLFNDLADSPWSIFNDTNGIDRLTRYDVLLLRMLYHPSLAAGTDRGRSARIVGQLASELPPSALDPAEWARPARD